MTFESRCFANGESFAYDRRADAGVAFDVFFLMDNGSIPLANLGPALGAVVFVGVASVFPVGMKGCLRLRGRREGVSGVSE